MHRTSWLGDEASRWRRETVEPELKSYLDAMREDLSAQIATSSARAETSDAETREHAVRLNAKTREHAERLNAKTREHAERLNAGTREHAERLNAETREHFEELHRQDRILIEDLHQDVRAVAEGVQTVNEKLDRICSDHERRIQRLEERMP